MSIGKNLESVRRQIEEAAQTVGRLPSDVTLVAVSKTQPVDAILEAYEAGQRHFGESRLQEAWPKIQALPKDIVWHFIGTMQTNKAKRIASVFDLIHTLAKPEHVDEASKAGRAVYALIEVNIGNEPQKAGAVPEILDELRSKIIQSPNVCFRGLMTVGPHLTNADAVRPYFSRIRNLAEAMGAEFISMGMSEDFEVAIQEGSTHVRIGTAIFGSRLK